MAGKALLANKVHRGLVGNGLGEGCFDLDVRTSRSGLTHGVRPEG